MQQISEQLAVCFIDWLTAGVIDLSIHAVAVHSILAASLNWLIR